MSCLVRCPRPPVLVNQCLRHYVCQKGCLSPPSRVGSLEHQHFLSFLHHEVSALNCHNCCQLPFPRPSVCFGVGSKAQALSAAKVSLSGPRPPEGASARVSPNLDTACGSMATRARLSCSHTRPIWGFHPKCSCITFCLSTPLSVSCHCPATVVCAF